jgi:cyclohexyl-isocyanide hydratase
MGLTLASKLFDEESAKVVQLASEYDPQPPFDSGAPSKVSKEFLTVVAELMGEPAPV